MRSRRTPGSPSCIEEETFMFGKPCFRLVLLAAALGMAPACNKSGQGQLAVQLTDAPAPVDEIWVNVTSVRAHDTTSGWTTVSSTPVTVDLLKLQNYAMQLGIVTLAAGKVTQIRLVVAPTGNHVVVGGVEQPLEVPSGIESGIKIHGPWEIDSCQQTTVTLDFDGHKSIWYHPTGQGDSWILRPVIRTKRVEQTPGSCEGGGGEGSGGAGASCTGSAGCLSGVCTGSVCQPGGAGAPCHVNADCTSSQCDTEVGTCSPGSALPAGQPCTVGSECLSNSCVANACAPGVQGAPCNANTDCQAGLTCQQISGQTSCAEAPAPRPL
jgi:hypothetical protein